MPRPQGLLKRGSRWFSNIKIPKDLQPIFGKQHIREALGTSDFREACRKISFDKARWLACFDSERKKLARLKPSPLRDEPRILTTLSKREAFEIATRYPPSVLRDRYRSYNFLHNGKPSFPIGNELDLNTCSHSVHATKYHVTEQREHNLLIHIVKY